VATRPWRRSGCPRLGAFENRLGLGAAWSARIPPAGERFRTCWQPAVRQDREDRPGATVAELTALGRHVGLARRHAPQSCAGNPFIPAHNRPCFPSAMFRYWGHYVEVDGDAVDLDVHMRAPTPTSKTTSAVAQERAKPAGRRNGPS
jgi:hypothetical protein